MARLGWATSARAFGSNSPQPRAVQVAPPDLAGIRVGKIPGIREIGKFDGNPGLAGMGRFGIPELPIWPGSGESTPGSGGGFRRGL
jgi:hypothetical protein